MENQIQEQNFETEGCSNGYLTQRAVGSKQPKGASSGPTSGVATPRLVPLALLLLQRLGAVALYLLQLVLRSIKASTLGSRLL